MNPHLIARRLARRQLVSHIDEGEQRLDVVVAVLPPPPNMQREVDLGEGDFGDCHDQLRENGSTPVLFVNSDFVRLTF